MLIIIINSSITPYITQNFNLKRESKTLTWPLESLFPLDWGGAAEWGTECEEECETWWEPGCEWDIEWEEGWEMEWGGGCEWDEVCGTECECDTEWEEEWGTEWEEGWGMEWDDGWGIECEEWAEGGGWDDGWEIGWDTDSDEGCETEWWEDRVPGPETVIIFSIADDSFICELNWELLISDDVVVWRWLIWACKSLWERYVRRQPTSPYLEPPWTHINTVPSPTCSTRCTLSLQRGQIFSSFLAHFRQNTCLQGICNEMKVKTYFKRC